MLNWQWDRNVTSSSSSSSSGPSARLIGPARHGLKAGPNLDPSACLSDLSFDAAALVNFSTSFYYGCVSLPATKKRTETKHPHTLLRILPLHLPHPLPDPHTHVGFVDCFGFFIYLIKFRNTPANNLWLWNLHINPAKCCQIIELINIYLGQLPTPPSSLPYPYLSLAVKPAPLSGSRTFNPCWLS